MCHYMKKILLTFVAFALSAMLFSCKKDQPTYSEYGTLTFGIGSALEVNEEVETKASAADGSYIISIFDENGVEKVNMNYAAALANPIKLLAGNYTFRASSIVGSTPEAVFDEPVYGAEKEFTITAGQNTELGTITCTLQQVKVTVGYNEEFLSHVTGDCTTTVTVKAGFPLSYALSYNNGSPEYDETPGYFLVDSQTTTMEVVFKGSIDGKSQRQSKVITGIKAKQWRKIQFQAAVNQEGNVSFSILIDDYVEDLDLTYDTGSNEGIIGEDPDAPQGDGGITLAFDYEAGCDTEFTSFSALPIPALPEDGGREMKLKMYAEIPNGVLKFTVEIDSTNSAFVNSVGSINDGSNVLDLVNPSNGAIGVFTQILPFPYGDDVKGKTYIKFDLSDAQVPLLTFEGTHKFVMHVTDKMGCKKDIALNMIVTK